MTAYVHRALPARVPMAPLQGTLALEYDPPPERLSVVEASDGPTLRLVPGGRAELESFAHRFASVVVEVVGGDRGPSQLLRWTTERVYEDLTRRAAALQRTTPSDRRVRRLRSQIRSVRVFCPSPCVAEVSVHVRQGQRSKAIAARLELVQGRWCCTALEFG
jgi:hypothetical protein